jgi:CBS domain-containing protein
MSITNDVRQATRQAVQQLGSLRDQARLQLHLLSKDAQQRWTELETEIATLEERASRDGEKAAETLKETAQGLSRTLTDLVGTLSHSPGLLTNVRSVMSSSVRSCAPEDSLARAAQTMWDADCGALPIVANGKVVAMLTDRDVCMTSYFQGKPLGDLRVADAMSKHLLSCGPDDSLTTVLATMSEQRVRRLPVVGPSGDLLGVLSQADVLRWARSTPQRDVERAVLEALADISALTPQKVRVDED